MTWEIVGKAMGTALLMFAVAFVQAILRWTFGVEGMESAYEFLVFAVTLSAGSWVIWVRQP